MVRQSYSLLCALLLGALLLATAVPSARADEGRPADKPFAIHLPLLAGAGAPVADEPDDEAEVVPGPPANWDVDDDQPAEQTQSATAGSPTDCLGATTRTVRYTSDGVIHVAGCGQTFTLSDVDAAPVVDDSKLHLIDAANKIWLLKVKLKVEEGATLKIIGGAAGDANWLRLRSDASSGIWLKTENGTLLFQNTKVTSWDTNKNAVDSDYSVAADGSGGRSYIAARSIWTEGRPTAAPTPCDVNGGTQEPYEARMTIIDAEFGYLGYNAAESYGLTWKVYSKTPPPGRQLYEMVDIFGDVSGSSFHHNYFGSYTYGAYCMNWTDNTFENNAQYGLDPHDDSDYLTITGNMFRDNGNHGVICSMYCNNLVIRGNQSYGNLHGIMVHRQVNGAIIEDNVSANNRKAGIAIFDSYDAVVRNNTVSNNGEAAVRLSVGAARNLIEDNVLTGLSANGSGSGYVVYTYKGSDAPTTGDGLPRDNIVRNNQIVGFKRSAIKIGDGVNNLLEGNSISGPAPQFEFIRQATGNVVRDSALGSTFDFKLDSTSNVTLEDRRGAVWQVAQTNLSTTATPDGSRLALTYANVGSSAQATLRDLAVRPASGAVAVQPLAWSAASKRWSEQADAASGAVAHTVGELQPGAAYAVTMDGQALGTLLADAEGHISFETSAGAATFEVVPAPPAASATLTPTPAPPDDEPTNAEHIHWLPMAVS